MFVVTTLYITFGTCGYLSFGPETKAIITLNLPKGSGLDFGMLVKSCLCLGIFFTYPVMMFPVIKILENYFLPDATKSVWKANMLRFLLVVLTGFVVLAVPNFANLMALVGASCCTLLAFILPGVFHMNIFKGCLTRSQKWLDWFLIIVGICGTIVGTMDALKRLSDGPEMEDLSLDTTTIATDAITPAAIANLTHLVSPLNISPLNVSAVTTLNSTLLSSQAANLTNMATAASNNNQTQLIAKVMQNLTRGGKFTSGWLATQSTLPNWTTASPSPEPCMCAQ